MTKLAKNISLNEAFAMLVTAMHANDVSTCRESGMPARDATDHAQELFDGRYNSVVETARWMVFSAEKQYQFSVNYLTSQRAELRALMSQIDNPNGEDGGEISSIDRKAEWVERAQVNAAVAQARFDRLRAGFKAAFGQEYTAPQPASAVRDTKKKSVAATMKRAAALLGNDGAATPASAAA